MRESLRERATSQWAIQTPTDPYTQAHALPLPLSPPLNFAFLLSSSRCAAYLEVACTEFEGEDLVVDDGVDEASVVEGKVLLEKCQLVGLCAASGGAGG